MSPQDASAGFAASMRLAAQIAAYGVPGSLHDYPQQPLGEHAWRSLLHMVQRQRLTGMLVGAIDAQSWPATAEQAAAALDAHLDAVNAVLQLERVLLTVHEELSTVGIEPRVLKGSAVAHLDYARPHERLFGDVDLLVRADQFDLAVAALVEAGYRRRFPEPRPGFDRRFSKGTSFVTPSGFELDLHRTFVMGPYGLLVDLDDVWSEPASFWLAGQRITALSAEVRFLHACFHAALGDVVPRLVPQRDVAQMLLSDRLDMAVVRSLMQSWQAEAVVARAVSLAWETLAVADEVALSAQARRYSPTQRENRYLGVYTDPHGSYAAKELVALGAIPRWRDRAAFLHALLLPERGYVQGRHTGRIERLRQACRAVQRGRDSR